MHTILIIGAGFCGAVTAVQLVRQGHHRGLRVILLNRSGRMARGLAYGTQSAEHTLNVPAGNMSALDGEPDHFLDFARRIDSMIGPASFVSRQIYGDYLEALLHDAEQAGAAVTLERITGEVSALAMGSTPCACRVTLTDGRQFAVDQVVLAFGHFPSNQPKLADAAFYTSRRYVRDPWSAQAIDAIAPSATTLLLGSGLTALDVAATLLKRSPERRIRVISRHGLLPKTHRSGPVRHTPMPLPAVFDQQPGQVRAQLRAFRAGVRALSGGGEDWRELLNALRPHTHRLWHALPEGERRRFLRHVQPYWDNHRHRAAPAIHQRFSGAIETGAITVHGGRIVAIDEREDDVLVRYRPRGHDREESIVVQHVINCIGPSSDLRTGGNELIRRLLADGLIRSDALHLGLDVAANGAIIDAEGMVSRTIYYVGPLLKAHYWEATAVPELRRFSAQLATTLLAGN